VKLAAFVGFLAVVLTGCGGKGAEPKMTTGPAVEGFAFTSASEVENGKPVPARFTCDGKDVSPKLVWTGVPDGAKELALVLEDPDAPSGTFTHWLVYDLNLSVSEFGATGWTAYAPGGPPRDGTNDFGKLGYGGPCPPRGQTHHYVFRLLALDKKLDLEPASDRSAFEKAIAGHVLAEARLTTTYARS